ncbi:MAG: FAD-dependent oxidoreductase [Paucibacter sp.]|nr:FAD-dependent oxidoreductase [Roseateles sp.]
MHSTRPEEARPRRPTEPASRMRIAVVGSGIAGLSCAWMLAERHKVTVFEGDHRVGGHSNTVEVPDGNASLPVDTGFIVYNEPAYPNLSALFRHLEVPTLASDMSFAVSLDRGGLEYAGTDLRGLFAQKRNLIRPRFWSMLRELMRFNREAPRDAATAGDQALDAYLDAHGYGRALRDDHLYPMAAAIWSAPAAEVGRYPFASFVRFCENHGLLQVNNRPVWRTVDGGSRQYVERLRRRISARLQLEQAVLEVRREHDESGQWVRLRLREGWWPARFDAVVLATHANHSLAMLAEPTLAERRLLGAFSYTRNLAVLHSDTALMPQRRAVWSSWNYLAERGSGRPPTVSYWMNRLQPHLPRGPGARPLIVTLNPPEPPRPEHLIRTELYEHPLFDAAAMRAQRELWSIQGTRGVWYCGAYFGAGFHEDGLQAGLAVAEQLGGVRRPWRVKNESGRIHVHRPVPVAS